MIIEEALDGIFDIKERFSNKKLLLYGLNDDTKIALSVLTTNDVVVDGFLLTLEQQELAGICYLGKRCIGRDEYQINHSYDDYMILDVDGKNSQTIKNDFGEVSQILYKTEKEICIYGAGEAGKIFYDNLYKYGIEVKCFVDRYLPQGSRYGKCEIKNWDYLRHIKNEYVVIANNSAIIREEINNELLANGIKNIGYTDCDRFQKLYAKSFTANGIYYLQKILKKKKVFLFSNEVDYLKQVLHELKVLGITGCYGVSESVEQTIKIDDSFIINAYEIMYEKNNEYIVWALSRESKNAKCFMDKVGLNKCNYLYDISGPLLLDRDYILDTDLGYIDSRGVVVIRNCSREDNIIKIAVLGGSTSDYDLYYEKAWPFFLLERAKKYHINMECIVAADAANISAQEKTKLERDIIKYRPDIVINYSGINEITHTCQNNRNTHIYQRDIFQRLANAKDDFNFFALDRGKGYYMGEKCDDACLEWINNNRMMHAVCNEFSIKHISFLQPWLYGKKSYSLSDLELMEHINDDYIITEKKISFFSELCEKYIGNYNWIINATRIFDNHDNVMFDSVHTFEIGSEIIASFIFDTLYSRRFFDDYFRDFSTIS